MVIKLKIQNQLQKQVAQYYHHAKGIVGISRVQFLINGYLKQYLDSLYLQKIEISNKLFSEYLAK